MYYNNPFFLFRTLWGALAHADWDVAAERGIFALIVEFFRTITGFNAWPFFVSLDSEWQPATIHPILQEHGIASWGWGKQGNEFFFQVKLRQATWAQYLLQQHGVPISGQLLDEGERSAYRPGPRRSLRQSPSTRIISHNTASPASTPQSEASTSLLSDPVGQINRTVDRLAKW